MQFLAFLHVFKETAELWDVAQLLCLQHFCPLLSREVLHSVYALSQHCSLAAAASDRAPRPKYISKRAAKPNGLCLLLRKKLSIDTASVCVDFALPLVFAGIWESAAGSESKAAVVGGMNSPTVTDREPCAGNTVSEPHGYFSLFPISHEFPVAIKVFALQTLQSHYSGN